MFLNCGWIEKLYDPTIYNTLFGSKENYNKQNGKQNQEKMCTNKYIL